MTMRSVFCKDVSNVTAFLNGIKAVNGRAASEANMIVVAGEPGLGKSRVLEWYAVQTPSVFVRAKADWTPKWALDDIASQLSVKHYYSTERQYEAVLAEILRQQEKKGFCLIVDEADHAARSLRVLETLRDITDSAEVPLILGGMKGIEAQLKRYRQVYDRVCKFIEFKPASVEDIRLIASAVSDAKIGDCMIELIQRRTKGSIRLALGAIAQADARYQRLGEKVTVGNFGSRPLLNDDREQADAA